MIILYCCLLLLAVHAVLPGSDLRRLGRLSMRHTWLVWLALAVQVVVMSVLPDAGPLSQAAHLGTYGLAAVFAGLNLRSAGTWVVAAGGALNLTAITANGGVMPASASAVAASGWQAAPGQFANSAVLAQPRLLPLGDVFATPAWLPVNSVFSVGDVLVVLGVAVFLHLTCRRPVTAADERGDVTARDQVGRR
ncbi:DUF5317 family protein [Aquipuribacter sp. MA13-6]|uniref:DUF5317 family protein n=1 Tax=unclassified Aquipuribacter TaxID=2635084 RepID=UPI003EED6CF3